MPPGIPVIILKMVNLRKRSEIRKSEPYQEGMWRPKYK